MTRQYVNTAVFVIERMRRYFVILVILTFSISLWSQGPPPASNTPAPERDSTTISSNSILDIFYGNPGKAAFYGLIVPGGGQIYNKKWWKLPLVYALEGGLIAYIYDSTKNYNGFQNAYKDNLDPDIVGKGFRGITATNVLLTQRNKYRQQREYAWVFFIGGHLITIFEAFIDRHLMEFDVSDDLSFKPIFTGLGPVGGITYTIPLNKVEKKTYVNLMGE